MKKATMIFGFILILLTMKSVFGTSDIFYYKMENTKLAGTLIDGLHTVNVSFWTASSGGTSPFNESIPSTNFSSGEAFITVDSSKTPLDFTNDYWVLVTINGTNFTRSAVGSHPNALQANDTLKLGGKTEGNLNVNKSNWLDAYQATDFQRVLQNCSAGNSVRSIMWNGSVTCEADSDTTYSAGTGLIVASEVFSLLWTNLTPFTNTPGFYTSYTNFTGNRTNSKICTWDDVGGMINCSYTDQSAAATNTDTNVTEIQVTSSGSTHTLSLEQPNLTNLTTSWDDLANSTAEIRTAINISSQYAFSASDLVCTNCISGVEISVMTDADVSNNITIDTEMDIITTQHVNATQHNTVNWKIYEDAGGNLIIEAN